MPKQRKSKLARFGIDRARVDVLVEAQNGSDYSKGSISFGHSGYEGRFEPVYEIEFQRHRLDRGDSVSIYEQASGTFDQGGPWSAFYGGHPDGHRLDVSHPDGIARLADVLKRIHVVIEKRKIDGNCDLARFAQAAEALGLAVKYRWIYRGTVYTSAELPAEVKRDAAARFVQDRKHAELREEIRRELLAESAGRSSGG